MDELEQEHREPRWTGLAFLVVAFGVLFGGFDRNAFGVAEDRWFKGFSRSAEDAIWGRLMQSRESGLFAKSGLLGGPYRADPSARRMYFTGRSASKYGTYKSQSGGQGLFSALDRVLPLRPSGKYYFFRGLTSGGLALAVALIATWVLHAFGWTPAVLVVLAALASQWLVVFAPRMFWSLWIYYLPCLCVAAWLQRGMPAGRRAWTAFGALVFALVLTKCFMTGYDWVTTALVMMVVPCVYWSLARGSAPLLRLARSLGVAVLASLLAGGVSLLILAVQIDALPNEPPAGELAQGSVQGSAEEAGQEPDEEIERGAAYLLTAWTRRTRPDLERFPQYGRDVPLAEMVGTYLDGSFFAVGLTRWTQPPVDEVPAYAREEWRAGRGPGWRISYRQLVWLFALASAVVLWPTPGLAPQRRRERLAFVAATWFSILAPLSWFAIFRSHSAIHLHTNFVVWQMPFVLLGFALVGLALQRVAGGALTFRARSKSMLESAASTPGSSR